MATRVHASSISVRDCAFRHGADHNRPCRRAQAVPGNGAAALLKSNKFGESVTPLRSAVFLKLKNKNELCCTRVYFGRTHHHALSDV